MRIDIITAVPQVIESPLETSILKRAKEKGIVEIVVHDLHDEGVDALDEFVGDIDGEGTEAAGVGSSLLIVDVNGGVVVHGTEVQDDVFALPVGGDGELTRIP